LRISEIFSVGENKSTVRLSFKVLETEIIGFRAHFLDPLTTKRGFVSLEPAISL